MYSITIYYFKYTLYRNNQTELDMSLWLKKQIKEWGEPQSYHSNSLDR